MNNKFGARFQHVLYNMYNEERNVLQIHVHLFHGHHATRVEAVDDSLQNNTHIHTHQHRFNGHLRGEPGLAGGSLIHHLRPD